MASPFLTESLMVAIKDAIVSAWGNTSRVYYGLQRTDSANVGVPVANIIFQGATIVASRVNLVRYSYTFEIIGRFSYPASSTDYIEFEKNDKLNALHNAMITGTTFAGIGDLHNITAVSHDDLADDGDNLYTVSATFTVECEHARV